MKILYLIIYEIIYLKFAIYIFPFLPEFYFHSTSSKDCHLNAIYLYAWKSFTDRTLIHQSMYTSIYTYVCMCI